MLPTQPVVAPDRNIHQTLNTTFAVTDSNEEIVESTKEPKKPNATWIAFEKLR